MSRYRFELATADDDADLRHVLARTPTEGRIAVAFRREPSWFAGAAVDGQSRQVISCRDLETGRIIGFGCRSIREVFINGLPDRVGYLSSLRLLPEYRNLGLVARGYAALRELHGDGQVSYYVTTIASGNQTAVRVLTSGRAGLPAYHPAGAYHTVAIALSSRRIANANGKVVRIRSATEKDVPAVVEFLRTVGPRRQFFPRLEADDFLSPAGVMRGLCLDNTVLAERGAELVGMLAGWDQHSYRQSVVCAYHGWLRWVKPFYNAGAWLTARPGLPRPGAEFRYLMAALPVVAEDDEYVFISLLEALRWRAAGGPWTHVLVGLHEADPLFEVVKRFQAAFYVTQLYVVCWPDGEPARHALDDRTPYLEAGSL
jgi:hypothetical protein